MRSGEASFATFSGGVAPSILVMHALRSYFLGEFERAGVNFAARPSGEFHGMSDRVLYAVALKRSSQHFVQGVVGHCLRAWRWRANHQHEIATRLQPVGR